MSSFALIDDGEGPHLGPNDATALQDALKRIKALEDENKQLKSIGNIKFADVGKTEAAWEQERDCYIKRTMFAEQELKLVKALLLLQNVESSVKLNDNSKPREVLLAGDADLLAELMTLRKQVRFLKQQCLVIRAQVLQLVISIPQTVKWVQESAHTAIESHAQQRRDLQHRLSQLKSVLKT